MEERMVRYAKEHKQETRQRIIRAAARHFRGKGSEGAAIGDLMRDLHMTHGGFYRHFSGKDDVYAEAVRYFLCKKSPEPWQAKHAAAGRPPAGHGGGKQELDIPLPAQRPPP